jgi:uncharacterized protein involved in exopolysaccharide biosynthesis
METKQADLFDLLAVFARKRKLIVIFTIVVAIAAIIYSLITPQIWNSTTTFYTVGDKASSMPINLGSLSGLASSFLSTDSFAQGQNSVIILNSRTLSEEVIRRFNLIEYFHITEPDTLRAMDLALVKLSRKVLSVSLNDETGLIAISIETKDKQLSKEIAEYYLTRLELYNQEYKLTKGKRNRQFLEKRVEEVRKEIDSLSIAVKDFQKKHKAIDLQSQLTSVVEMYSDAVSQQIKNDIETEIARSNYPIGSPIVAELEKRSAVIRGKIRELELDKTGVKPKYMINIDSIPDLSLQYGQLMINLEIQKKVFEFIYPQYESARIEELRDMPTLEIVDYPREAGMRVRPKRAFLCIIATLAGFVISLVLALLSETIDKNSEKITQIRKIIFPK